MVEGSSMYFRELPAGNHVAARPTFQAAAVVACARRATLEVSVCEFSLMTLGQNSTARGMCNMRPRSAGLAGASAVATTSTTWRYDPPRF